MTLRELFLVVLSVAIGLAGLLSGGIFASFVIGLSLVTVVGIAIIAFVGHGPPRVASIGFLVPVISYASAVTVAGSSELQISNGKLPTTQLLWPAYRVIVRVNYTDPFTGNAVPKDDPRLSQPISGTFSGMSGLMAHETPARETFASLAHILFALAFGYIGSKFALWINRPNTTRADEP